MAEVSDSNEKAGPTDASAIEDAEVVSERAAGQVEPGERADEPAPPSPRPPRQSRRAGALQTAAWVVIVSVAISGAVGYSAARLAVTQSETVALEQIEAQARVIENLEGRIAELPVAPTQADIDAAAARAIESTRGALDAIEARLGDLAARLEALEARPFSSLPDGQFDDAMQAALASLEADLSAQRAEIERLASAAADELRSAQSAAAEVAAATAAAARDTLAKSALAQIAAALDTGVAFEGPLADLEDALGIAAPAGLAAVAKDGVATLSELQNGFPDAARAALAAARSAGEDGNMATNFFGFLRQQFEVRSVEPRAGDDVDAILSRAEAALRQGDLGAALAELGGLPAIASDQLAGWRARAEARAAAIADAAGLTDEGE